MNSSRIVNILLVDDDEIDVRGVKRALRKHGVDNPIRVAGDGLEALAILKGRDGSELAWPYIILLDINMPRMNGIEFLKALRADPQISDAVVFMLTTSDDERDITAAYQNHIAGYVLKSDAGSDFINLVSMLGSFTLTVRFPREHAVAETKAA